MVLAAYSLVIAALHCWLQVGAVANVAVILVGLGWALFVQGWLTLAYALAIMVFLDIKSRREEAWLMERFAGYADYRRRVRKLIPFIY